MRDERAKNAAARAADQSREAGLLGYAAGQRAKIANGTYTPSREWTPPRTELSDFISRSVSGIDPAAGEEPEPSKVDFDTAWSRLTIAEANAANERTDEGLRRMDEVYQEVKNERTSAEETAANREAMARENQANDPGSYGRAY